MPAPVQLRLCEGTQKEGDGKVLSLARGRMAMPLILLLAATPRWLPTPRSMPATASRPERSGAVLMQEQRFATFGLPTFELPTFSKPATASTMIQRYFDAWNRRDMDAACECFAEDCVYDDTQYAGAFQGKVALKQHLIRVVMPLWRRSVVSRGTPRLHACESSSLTSPVCLRAG